MLIIDPNSGAILDGNRAALAFYGWSLGELTSRGVQDINTMTDEEIQLEMENAKNQFRNHFFFRHRLASESIRDVEVYSGPIFYKGKKVLLSIIHDISNRVAAESALRESEQKYHFIADNMADVVFKMDIATERFTYASPSIKKVLGYEIEEVSGKLLNSLMSEKTYEGLIAILADDLARGNYPSRIQELEIINREGKPVFMEVNTSFLLGLDGTPLEILGIARDITERKTAEGEKEKLIEELQSALKDLKTLSGLIPICSKCKKIRDDKGYWNQLESYIEQHSESRFSHSLCPECTEELYGGEKWYGDWKKKEK